MISQEGMFDTGDVLTEDSKLTVKQGLEIVQGMETAEQDVKALKGNTSVLHLPAIGKPVKRSSKDHAPGVVDESQQCCFWEVNCHKCGQ